MVNTGSLGLELRARIDVSRGSLKIQVISVPQCQGVAFEVIQSLGTFRKANRSVDLSFLFLLEPETLPWNLGVRTKSMFCRKSNPWYIFSFA